MKPFLFLAGILLVVDKGGMKMIEIYAIYSVICSMACTTLPERYVL